jgi:hypothetical protein
MAARREELARQEREDIAKRTAAATSGTPVIGMPYQPGTPGMTSGTRVLKPAPTTTKPATIVSTAPAPVRRSVIGTGYAQRVSTGGGAKTWEQHHAQTDYAAIKAAALARSPQARQARSGVQTGGYMPAATQYVAAGGSFAGLGGLGARPLERMPAVQALKESMRRARAEAAARRRR